MRVVRGHARDAENSDTTSAPAMSLLTREHVASAAITATISGIVRASSPNLTRAEPDAQH